MRRLLFVLVLLFAYGGNAFGAVTIVGDAIGGEYYAPGDPQFKTWDTTVLNTIKNGMTVSAPGSYTSTQYAVEKLTGTVSAEKVLWTVNGQSLWLGNVNPTGWMATAKGQPLTFRRDINGNGTQFRLSDVALDGQFYGQDTTGYSFGAWGRVGSTWITAGGTTAANTLVDEIVMWTTVPGFPDGSVQSTAPAGSAQLQTDVNNVGSSLNGTSLDSGRMEVWNQSHTQVLASYQQFVPIGPMASTPEPASLGLLFCLGSSLMLRRKRSA